MFALSMAGQHVVARGVHRRLHSASKAALAADVDRFFATPAAAEGGAAPPPAVLVGAFPFNGDRQSALYQPQEFQRRAGPLPRFGAASDAARTWTPLQIVATPPPAVYASMVRKALADIAAGSYRKVVLARSLAIEASRPVDALPLACRLARDPDVTTFLVPLVEGRAGPPATMVGATPELLVSRFGDKVQSHPLAGSAARSADGAEDRAAAEHLLRSDKDRREHALVVEAVLDRLAPYCRSLRTPDEPALRATASMWHLGTRIEGTLVKDAPSAAGLAALLHPTPAVGGLPYRPAIAAIHALEPFDRGFYAGAVGWVDSAGDGEWYVTLRCAEIHAERLLLCAGAGIVAGSDPESEVAETAAKFTAMLSALAMEERDVLLEGVR